MISEIDFRVSPGYLRHQMDKTRHARSHEPLDRKCLHVNRKLRFCQTDLSHGEGHTWSWSREDKNLPQTMNCSQFQEQIYFNSNVNFKWHALTSHLFTWVFLPEKNPPCSLCTLREVHPRTYVKQCFLMRSPSWTTKSSLDPTSWSKINHNHNRNHTPPKVCRQEVALIIHHFIFHVIYSQLMETHTNYTCCCTSSRATCSN